MGIENVKTSKSKQNLLLLGGGGGGGGGRGGGAKFSPPNPEKKILHITITLYYDIHY